MKIRILTFLCASVLLASSAPAALIAYWSENSNNLPSGAFGFTPASFPQSPDLGAGSISVVNFNTAQSGPDNAYTYLPSFAGSLVNAQPGYIAGGSLSVQGGLNLSNNGAGIVLQVNATNYEDLIVSWAQQRSGTGFNSAEFAYSTDGVTYTSFATNAAIPAAYGLVSYDLSTVAALDGAATAFFKITLTGATNATGNNRFDNFTVTGTPTIPEPGTAVLAMLSLAAAGAVTMRSRLG